MKPRIVKLRSTQILRRQGFVLAVRYEHRCDHSDRLERVLEQRLGPGWDRWSSQKGRAWGIHCVINGRPKSYWVAVQHPRDLTSALLSIPAEAN